MALSGVRSSWLIIARKSDLAMLARSAFTRASSAVVYSLALSIATAARRASSDARSASAWLYRRAGLLDTSVSAPMTSSRSFSGTQM